MKIKQEWIGSSIAAAIYSPKAIEKPERILIFIHGWGGSKTERDYAYVQWAKQLSTLTHATSILFDFFGHGESQGDFSEVTYTSMQRDIDNVLNWVNVNYAIAKVYLLASGFSARIAWDITNCRSNCYLINGICMFSPVFIIPEALNRLQGPLNEAHFDEPAIREAITLMGGLPDHIRGEIVETGWMKESTFTQIPANHFNISSMLVYDKTIHSPETAELLEKVDNILECSGGGSMFRTPELLQTIGDNVADWINNIERMEMRKNE